MKIPSFFKVRTAEESREHFRLDHSNQTTTDFFRLKPSMIREMVPQDKFTAHVESLCRFLPMPLPTYGSINFANRAFFVPARQLMEGFNEFLEGTPYRNGNGTYNISHVPQIANSTFADYIKDLSDPFYKLLSVTLDVSNVYGGKVIVFLDQQGRAVYVNSTQSSVNNGSPILLTYALSSGVFIVQTYGSSEENDIEGALEYYMLNNFGVNTGSVNIGDYGVTQQAALTLSTIGEHLFGDPDVYETYHPVSGNSAYKLILSGQEFQPSEIESYSIQHYDFTYAFVAYRFTKQAKNVYDLLKNLGYSVDFSSGIVSGSYVWLNGQYVSAMQLLAYFRVYLDYYLDPQYYGTLQSKYGLFFGVNKTLSKSELANIVDMLVVNYDRDYFTAAWQNPTGPNTADSGVNQVPTIVDINSVDPSAQYTSVVGEMPGATQYPGTPSLFRNYSSSRAPMGITQYMIDALKMVSDYMHRHQLAGYRAFDRFFAEFGVKLSDDRAGRCYFLDSQNYSTTVKDIMSTAATQDASLGDYAGKAVAYSGKKSITYEADEFGYFIIMSSCTPTVGYVQGTKRENFHLSRYDFHRGQFDNLGVQPIRKDELFADYGLSSFDGKGIVSYPSDYAPDGVFGFSPRYAEYKVGHDILSGDFIIPSRRSGLDAFHLYRLFSGRDAINLGQSFVTGDQSQYDRIFNDTSDEYDHIYQVHSIVIDAYRPMKSITEVICFDDEHGREIDIPANGTMLN